MEEDREGKVSVGQRELREDLLEKVLARVECN